MHFPSLVRMGWSWWSGRTRLGYAPREITIEPTNVCNYRCSFCPQSLPEHHQLPKGRMTLEQLDEILEKVLASGAAWNGRVAFTHDGEPFVHPDFVEFVRRANARGLRPRFSSNGSLVTREKVDQLEAAGGFTIAVDFSGSPEIFESHRGPPGHWERVRRNLSHLVEVSNRNPAVHLEIFEIGGLVLPAERGRLIERLKASLPPVTSARVEFGTRVFHNASGAVTTAGAPARSARYRQCPYPWVSMNIAWDGSVHACCRDLQGRTRLGNLLQVDDLWEIWNGEAFERFREAIASRQPEKIAACAGCDLPWSGDPAKWSLANIVRTLRHR